MKPTVFAILMMLAVPAGADYQRGSQVLAAFGGVTGTSTEYDLFPGGGSDGIASPGYASGGQYLFYVTHRPALAFGIDASVMHLAQFRSTDLVSGSDSSTYLHSNVLQLIEKLSYPQGRWRPYVFGGIGIHRSALSLTAKPLAGQTWRDTGTSESRVFVSDSATGLAVSWGVGLEIFLNDNIFVGPEYRGLSLGHTAFNQTPAADSLGLNTDLDGIVLNSFYLRVGVTFGK